MKFCIIVDKKRNTVLGQEYEQPWSYSEYTSGGGCYNIEWIELSRIFGSDCEERKPLIFQTKEKALSFAKHNYRCEGKDIEIIMLKDM